MIHYYYKGDPMSPCALQPFLLEDSDKSKPSPSFPNRETSTIAFSANLFPTVMEGSTNERLDFGRMGYGYCSINLSFSICFSISVLFGSVYD